MTLSGVLVVLFSGLILMGVANAREETLFAGSMLIFSAVLITLTIPFENTLLLLYLSLRYYVPGLPVPCAPRKPEEKEAEFPHPGGIPLLEALREKRIFF
jgi:hypothetical protein